MSQPVRVQLLASLALLLAGASRPAGDFNPFEGPRAIAVFIETDPWAMVMGADNPRVVVYEDGQVNCDRRTRERVVYRTFMLDAAGLAKVREAMRPVLGLTDLKPYYDIQPAVTDQPEAEIYLRDGEREVVTSVYGLVAGGSPPYVAPDPEAECPPKEVLTLHRWLSKLDDELSVEWVPKYVDVMLWSYSYAPEESIQWPKDWPSLDSDRAVKRGDSWSIFLDGTQLPRLRELLATRKEKGALEIAGQKMAVSVRCTFPGEPTWRAAFAKAAAKTLEAGR